MPDNGRKWLFVVGPARTGTSLVAWLLSQHPDCLILNDSGMVWTFSRTVDPPYKSLAGTVAFRGVGEWGPPVWSPWNGRFLIAAADKLTLVRELCEGVRRAAGDPLVFGDKDPDVYCWLWPELLQLWPDAIIIKTERGRYATANSRIKACERWGIGIPTAKEALGYHDDQCAAAADCPAARVVRMEELEANPEREIRALIACAGLDMETYPLEEAIAQVAEPKEKVS